MHYRSVGISIHDNYPSLFTCCFLFLDAAAGLSYEWETGKPYSWMVPPPPPELARARKISHSPSSSSEGDQDDAERGKDG